MEIVLSYMREYLLKLVSRVNKLQKVVCQSDSMFALSLPCLVKLIGAAFLDNVAVLAV